MTSGRGRARPRIDFIYTKNFQGGDATENGDFQRRKQRLQGYKNFQISFYLHKELMQWYKIVKTNILKLRFDHYSVWKISGFSTSETVDQRLQRYFFSEIQYSWSGPSQRHILPRIKRCCWVGAAASPSCHDSVMERTERHKTPPRVVVRVERLELSRPKTQEPKSCASANSATPAESVRRVLIVMDTWVETERGLMGVCPLTLRNYWRKYDKHLYARFGHQEWSDLTRQRATGSAGSQRDTGRITVNVGVLWFTSVPTGENSRGRLISEEKIPEGKFR